MKVEIKHSKNTYLAQDNDIGLAVFANSLDEVKTYYLEALKLWCEVMVSGNGIDWEIREQTKAEG